MNQELKFKKESALARSGMSIERLMAMKARAEARLELMRNSEIFAASDIKYVEASIRDLDRRINVRRVRIARKAREELIKQASSFIGTEG